MAQGSTPILLTIHGKRLGLGAPASGGGGVDGFSALILDGNIVASPNSTDIEQHASIQLANAATGVQSGKIYNSVSSAITALAGGTLTSAAPLLTDSYNLIAVCATTSDSVQLPFAALTSTLGAELSVTNEGAATAAVFPFLATTDIINALTSGASVPLAAQKTARFVVEAVGKWRSIAAGTSV